MFVEYIADFLVDIGDIPALLLWMVLVAITTVIIMFFLLRLTPTKRTPDAVIDFLATCIPALIDMRLTPEEMKALADAGQALVDTFRPEQEDEDDKSEKE